MSMIVYGIAYLAVIVFLAAVAKKVVDYLKKPIHIRWELYPVAHEGKRASYGGSYLEDVDWWKKPRHKSMIGELKVMVPEILLLKAVWENNRPLWFLTYPFHLGLYLIIGFMGLLGLDALIHLTGIFAGSALVSALTALTGLVGPAGFLLCLFGACGLFYRRLTDSELRNYSAPSHFINLGLFVFMMAIALGTWLFADPQFVMAREFARGFVGFHPVAFTSGLFAAQVLAAFLLMAYIPLTHMAHFFMKYFLYHDIRWGDAPNINSPETDRKIGIVLNYPVSWSAPHIAGDGKKTWAQVATFNPAAPAKAGKE
ncbi:MAG: respiratory nitrate reductase subunit gamma [Thermodesulfobacteriota bacterium]